jgi:hypothetical protein
MPAPSPHRNAHQASRSPESDCIWNGESNATLAVDEIDDAQEVVRRDEPPGPPPCV